MARFPSGMDRQIAPHLRPDETFLAATFAERTSASDDVMAMLIGGLGRKAARKTGLSDDAPPPLPGLAGTIYPGEVLVAVTDRRLLVYPRAGAQLHHEPTWFEPGAVVLVSWSRAVLGAQSLDIRFGDNTFVSLSLPSSNHGKHVDKAARALLARGAPPR